MKVQIIDPEEFQATIKLVKLPPGTVIYLDRVFAGWQAYITDVFIAGEFWTEIRSAKCNSQWQAIERLRKLLLHMAGESE